MELSMDNMDIVAGGILAIMLALFMLTVIVILVRTLTQDKTFEQPRIYKIEEQVSDYIDELSRSESDKLEIEHKAHQNGVISSVLQEIFP